ncbi:hypothetical protein JHK87_000261 [Glycine soja]|nr:hypothetical protein JHK87_000261 [Glycine soja]
MPKPPVESLTWVRGAAKVRRLALTISILVGLIAVPGAFVAGNDVRYEAQCLQPMTLHA